MRVARLRSPFFLCLLCFFILSWSAVFPLRSGEGLASPALVRFAVIGDSGSGDEHQQKIADRMTEWHARLPFDLVLMLGDNIYGGTFGAGGGDAKDFPERFDQPYEALLTRGVFFRAALGNHDMRHRDGLDLVDAYDRFHIEHPDGYYSFTAGTWNPAAGAAGLDGRGGLAPLVEFFVINTVRLEKDKEDPLQLEWLERALGGSRARWRIVYGHHPLYSTGKRHGADPKLRAKLEPIFLKAPEAGASGLGVERGVRPVDVVLAGHDHIFQRFLPQRGIAYFVCGSSGKLRRGNAEPDASVAAVNDREHVFMLWEATPDELRFRAINEHGVAFDCGILRSGQALQAVDCAAY
ncbi:MAG: metallophosphoesterase [Acidobacteria bacterium]|nr:metallophosphoesterase [Acidobacteriota bacterium]